MSTYTLIAFPSTGAPEASPAPEAFRIDTLDKLAWFGRKRSEKLAGIAAVEANAAAILRDLRKELEDFDGHFMAQAENLAMSTLQATGAKTKTLKTLGGSFAFRTVPGGIRKADPAALLKWAKVERPELVDRTEIVKEDVSAATLKLFFNATGEVPPGAEIIADRDTFTHKADA